MKEDFSFGVALEKLLLGRRVARAGWNGKSMWLVYIPEWTFNSTRGVIAGDYPVRPMIAMKTADEMLVPWVASQSDMLAFDWMDLEY